MGGISGFAAIEVLIGLSFLFFLLGTACSAIQEMLASTLGWRAKTLEDAVGNMLGNPAVRRGVKEWIGGVDKKGADPAAEAAHENVALPADLTKEVFEHWRIKALVRDPDSKQRRRSRPSYLPPRALSLAVAETLARHAPADEGSASGTGTPWKRTDDEILAAVHKALEDVPLDHPRELLQKAAVNAHSDLEGFRTHVETAFEDAMERASGWYKRKAQLVLALLATIFAVGFNVDAVRVGSQLYNDEAVRTAVVSRVPADQPQQAADAVTQVKQLQLPLGWAADNTPSDIGGWLSRMPGWLITIAALNLGAPFWFDVLSRISRQRGAGTPEKPTRMLSDKVATDVDEVPAAMTDRRAARPKPPGDRG